MRCDIENPSNLARFPIQTLSIFPTLVWRCRSNQRPQHRTITTAANDIKHHANNNQHKEAPCFTEKYWHTSRQRNGIDHRSTAQPIESKSQGDPTKRHTITITLFQGKEGYVSTSRRRLIPILISSNYSENRHDTYAFELDRLRRELLLHRWMTV